MSADPESRAYPPLPVVGVGAIVLAADQVLLIRRGRPPLLGAWSLPGGRLELGETLAEGCRREILEETGLRVRPLEIVATVDRIIPDAEGRVQYHYVVIDWLCLPEDSENQTAITCGDDACEARWISLAELADDTIYNLDAATLEVIDRAVEHLRRSME